LWLQRHTAGHGVWQLNNWTDVVNHLVAAVG
jgi:hypothetical protein